MMKKTYLLKLEPKTNLKKVSRNFLALTATIFLAIEGVAVSAPSWSNKPSWSSEEAAKPAAPPSNSSYRRAPKQEIQEVMAFAPGSNNVSLEIGQNFLMGDLADRYNNNIGFRVHYTYGVSDMFGFDAAIGHSSHDPSEKVAATPEAQESLSMTSFQTGMRMNLSWYDRVVPYATFGLGFYRPSLTVSPGNSVSPILFGLHLGPGVNLLITKQIFFGTSLTFSNIFSSTEKTAKGPREIGGTYTSFLVQTGMAF